MNILLVWLDGQAPSPRSLLLSPEGSVLARDLALPLAADHPRDFAAWLLVPGDRVHASWHPIRASHPLQARAAAQVALADGLATPPEQVHVALGADDGGDRLVAVCDRSLMQDWLQRATALGLSPAGILPDHLAIPAPESGARVIADGGDWIVRGPALSFRGEQALARQLLQDTPLDPLAGAEAERAIIAGTRAPAINLMQFEFAPAATERRTGWRRHLWLAALLLASPLILMAVEALRYQQAATELQAADAERIDRQLPGRPASMAAEHWLADALGRATHGATLASMLERLAAEARGASLQVLHFDAEGVLTATFDHADPAAIDALAGRLAAAGWQAQVASSRPQDGQLRSELVVRAGDAP